MNSFEFFMFCWGPVIIIMLAVLWLIWPDIPVGTKSLLVGVHQFAWHPLTVAFAWRGLYKAWPIGWRRWLCILWHDWGYWGCTEMDSEQGQLHTVFGAKLAARFFKDPRYWYLCKYHSRHLSKKYDQDPSMLCWPDKLSMMYDPIWFYLFRARLSGEIKEYHRNAIKCGFITADQTQRQWLVKLREHLRDMAKVEAAKFNSDGCTIYFPPGNYPPKPNPFA